MIRTSIFTDAYTHTLRQHSNIFLGYLQLLFWFVFRTIALRDFIRRMTREQLSRLVFQALILLMLLCSLVIGGIHLGFDSLYP
jgi:type VI protein secretion system component VasK